MIKTGESIKTRQKLIKKYVDFFKSKGHKEIPSASLIPTNDPTVLFTTAGMHPLVPFLLGQKHALGRRLVSVQKCIRTGDIDEVGDAVHHTFFEMLGNWSLGDYFKKEAIELSFEFLTKNLGIEKEKLAVSCFEGDKDAPKDEEAWKIWRELGIDEKRIAFLPKDANWWGPAGETGPCGPDTEIFFYAGPGAGKKEKAKAPARFEEEDEKWVEIWNNVFMQYNKTKEGKHTLLVDGMHCLYDKEFKINEELMNLLEQADNKKIVVINGYAEKAKELLKSYGLEVFSLEKEGIKKDDSKFFEKLLEKYSLDAREIIYFDHAEENIASAKAFGINSIAYKNPKQIKQFIKENDSGYLPLAQKNVDTGMGVERTLAVLNGLDDNYQTSLFLPIIKEIEMISGRKYNSNEQTKKAMRIIADHLKAAVFILGDERGIKPSNLGQGYVLRRLIRRAIRYARMIGIKEMFAVRMAKAVLPIYPDYQELHNNHKFIYEQLELEEKNFGEVIEKGLKKFNQLANDKLMTGKEAFFLFQSYGFPIEMTGELAEEKGIKIDLEEYNEEFKRHQDLSRTAGAGMFKSGLADDSERTRKLHTATHLLNQALRDILGKEVKQKGSNITPERLRFDFNFPRKLAADELKKVEELVNLKIRERIAVHCEEMPIEQAIKGGAQAEFGAKYPEMVFVYTIGENKTENGKGKWFSKEICTGPHVKNTAELGKFRIIKEEAVAAGVRRIKAALE